MDDVVAALSNTTDRGAWIQTFTGRAFYPLDPRPEDIDIQDIAHALSMQCRFTGHTREFYSVAEHCLRVSWLIYERCPTDEREWSKQVLLWGLLHDASEAYLVDVARPVKYLAEMEGYRRAEQATMSAICDRYGLPMIEPPEVKESDDIMLAVEALALMSPLRAGWERCVSVLAKAPRYSRIRRPMRPKQAEIAFLDRFHQLYEGE